MSALESISKQIITYNDWSKSHKLGREIYKCIHYTSTINGEGIEVGNGFLTKIYKFKNPKELKRMWQEFAMTRTLRIMYYNNIAFGKNENEIYMTMDALNFTLYAALSSQSSEKMNFSTNNELIYFILEIACNLDQLHSNNYLHLDIKPNNCGFRDTVGQIFYPQGNGWKLFDFDRMQYIKNGLKYIKVNGYIGTYGWSAPEMNPNSTKHNPNIISSKSDIWSFALLILYIINNGTNIFDIDVNGNNNNRDFYDKLMDFNMKTYLKQLWLKDKKISFKIYTLLTLMLKKNQNERISAKEIVKYIYNNFQRKQYVKFNERRNIYYMVQNKKRFKYTKENPIIPLIYETPKFEFGTNRF